MAAAAGDHKILRLLLRAGADPKQKTSKGALGAVPAAGVKVRLQCLNSRRRSSSSSSSSCSSSCCCSSSSCCCWWWRWWLFVVGCFFCWLLVVVCCLVFVVCCLLLFPKVIFGPAKLINRSKLIS